MQDLHGKKFNGEFTQEPFCLNATNATLSSLLMTKAIVLFTLKIQLSLKVLTWVTILVAIKKLKDLIPKYREVVVVVKTIKWT